MRNTKLDMRRPSSAFLAFADRHHHLMVKPFRTRPGPTSNRFCLLALLLLVTSFVCSSNAGKGMGDGGDDDRGNPDDDADLDDILRPASTTAAVAVVATTAPSLPHTGDEPSGEKIKEGDEGKEPVEQNAVASTTQATTVAVVATTAHTADEPSGEGDEGEEPVEQATVASTTQATTVTTTNDSSTVVVTAASTHGSQIGVREEDDAHPNYEEGGKHEANAAVDAATLTSAPTLTLTASAAPWSIVSTTPSSIQSSNFDYEHPADSSGTILSAGLIALIVLVSMGFVLAAAITIVRKLNAVQTSSTWSMDGSDGRVITNAHYSTIADVQYESTGAGGSGNGAGDTYNTLRTRKGYALEGHYANTGAGASSGAPQHYDVLRAQPPTIVPELYVYSDTQVNAVPGNGTLVYYDANTAPNESVDYAEPGAASH